MKEPVRKLGLIGAGLWAMTEERVNELVKDLVDKGDISKEEGKKKLFRTLSKRARNRGLTSKRKSPTRFRIPFQRQTSLPEKICMNWNQD